MICRPASRSNTILPSLRPAAFPSPLRRRPTACCSRRPSAAWTACCSLAATTSIPTFTQKICRAPSAKPWRQTPDGGGRDLRELVLLDEIFRQRKPLLAICRGHQLLNIALGGRLIADIRRQVPGALNHQRMDRAGELVHEASLTAGSLLARITGKRKLGVNSSHHQAVLDPAEPLTAVARTRDGIVEAMEWKPEAARRMPFLMSVQFHPERLARKHAEHRAIFSRFVEACKGKCKL